MASNIEILQPLDKFFHPEKRWTVSRVDNRIGQEEIRKFYRWFQDKESSRHFDPPITSLRECEEYYSQKENVFLVARNHYGDAIGILTMRREPFLKDSGGRDIAYLEKMIVRPDIQGKGIGKTLITTALNYVFGEESEVQWEECRLWIMTDREAGQWWRNYHLFIVDIGLQIVTDYPLWREYSRDILGEEVRRQALWLYTNPHSWAMAKLRNPRLQAASLELTHPVL